ncbi:MAG: ADP-heptose--LPS heptosyltransferase 2 [bacterium ADurb.Bin236]|nr:MAG: ADP-heptose--LPS heptosyltransferase 2 [bacterium ADurb.Bin236]HOY61752.1 glycosyltransferase family 9 protein [bacterium]HPN93407.1 glycosyltransferase family 9 protein [bacterium]
MLIPLSKKSPSVLRDIRKIGVYIGVPGLGDLLFITPLFRELKKLFPGAEVVFIGKLLRGYVQPVFDKCEYMDRLLEFHLYDSLNALSLARFVKMLRAEKFDLVVDTQRKLAPSLLLRLGGPRFMVGYSSKQAFSDFAVDDSRRDSRHTADLSLDLVRALGALNPDPTLEIPLPSANKEYAAAFLASNGVPEGAWTAGLIPCAGHPSRRWTSEKFAALASRLRDELGCSVICFGSRADKEVIDEIIAATGQGAFCEDFERGSILDSAALMSRCSVIVGVDSGPLHVADAAGAPCVGIYGPTLPERFGLIGSRSKNICLYTECSPCSDPECIHRKCLNQIEVAEVFNAARALLDNSASD